MKELTIEQKAKAYDEAIKRARYWEKNPTVWSSDDICQKLFLELKESEDEKIGKEIIAFLKENLETGTADETWSMSGLKRWIAWLEKQGEQKRQMPLVKSVPKDFKDRLGTLMHYTSVDLEKEENKQLLNEAAKELLQLAYSDKANEIALASAKTWEESMAILMAANNAYHRGQKEQKPAEWSEEDKDALKVVTEIFEQYGVHLLNYPTFVHWLKTLPERISLNPTWKPSGEQMYELTKAIDYYTSHGFPNKKLNELSKQLKNL